MEKKKKKPKGLINFIHWEWYAPFSEQSHIQCPCLIVLMMDFVSIFCSESFWITEVDKLSVFLET